MGVKGPTHLRGVADDLALVLGALVNRDVADLAVLKAEGLQVSLRSHLPPRRKAAVKDAWLAVLATLALLCRRTALASSMSKPFPLSIDYEWVSAVHTSSRRFAVTLYRSARRRFCLTAGVAPDAATHRVHRNRSFMQSSQPWFDGERFLLGLLASLAVLATSGFLRKPLTPY